MCDSISVRFLIDTGLTDEEYKRCRYPSRDRNNTDHSWIEFRSIYPTPTSPLTGAGFKITPFGMPIPGSRHNKKTLHGRVGGYEVEVNVPACLIGHNRQLVNGVPQAANAAHWLLKSWLAENGCMQEGLDRIRLKNARIFDLTTTALYLFSCEKEARAALYEFWIHSEALLNKKRKDGTVKKVARCWPEEPAGPVSDQTYTCYVRQREFMFIAYVKELDQPNAFLLPIADPRMEAEMQNLTVRTLRVEVRVYGKWLADRGLDEIAKWEGNDKAYEQVFNLLRKTLRLDDKLRGKRLKKTTIPTLKQLSAQDQKYLDWHVSKQDVKDHPNFAKFDSDDAVKDRYYAAHDRIEKATNFDIYLPYDVQTKLLSPRLSTLLVYPGEFQPELHLAGCLSSRTSVPIAIGKLKKIVADVIGFGVDYLPPVQDRTVCSGPAIPRKFAGDISEVPVGPDAKGEWVEDEAGWLLV